VDAEGTTDQVEKEPRSFTGRYLAPLLEREKGSKQAVAAE
jgi:excinuclease ABC subunit A